MTFGAVIPIGINGDRADSCAHIDCDESVARFVVGGDLQHVRSLLFLVVATAMQPSLRRPVAEAVRFVDTDRPATSESLSSVLTLESHQGFQFMVHQLAVIVCRADEVLVST
jgi:hypothetical protein